MIKIEQSTKCYDNESWKKMEMKKMVVFMKNWKKFPNPSTEHKIQF